MSQDQDGSIHGVVNLEHFQLLQSGAVMEAPFWEATPSPQQLLQMESYVSWKGNGYIERQKGEGLDR